MGAKYVYLVECANEIIAGATDVIAVCGSLRTAKRIKGWQVISKMALNKPYYNELGNLKHWHSKRDISPEDCIVKGKVTVSKKSKKFVTANALDTILDDLYNEKGGK